MIYLRPMGGLCNRMRAIDGFLTYVEKTGRPLTIIWINNNKLNCSFTELFEPLDQKGVRFIEFRPKTNLSHRIRVKFLDLAEQVFSPFFRRLYLGLALGKFRFSGTKTNPEWAGIYNSNEFVATQTMRETEAIFHKNTRPALKRLLDNTPVYISSCYRLFNSDYRYSRFVPTEIILKQIETVSAGFLNTTGLHIRANNHPYASKYSTVEKFGQTIEALLKKDRTTTFFLATDSGKVKEKLIDKFGESIIIVNPSNAYSRSDTEAIKQALVDLFCLSKTKKICGSLYSSFTLTASDIGEIEEVIVK